MAYFDSGRLNNKRTLFRNNYNPLAFQGRNSDWFFVYKCEFSIRGFDPTLLKFLHIFNMSRYVTNLVLCSGTYFFIFIGSLSNPNAWPAGFRVSGQSEIPQQLPQVSSLAAPHSHLAAWPSQKRRQKRNPKGCRKTKFPHHHRPLRILYPRNPSFHSVTMTVLKLATQREPGEFYESKIITNSFNENSK